MWVSNRIRFPESLAPGSLAATLSGVLDFGDVGCGVGALALYFVGCGYGVERWFGACVGFWVRCGGDSVLVREVDGVWWVEGFTGGGLQLYPRVVDPVVPDSVGVVEGLVLDVFLFDWGYRV